MTFCIRQMDKMNTGIASNIESQPLGLLPVVFLQTNWTCKFLHVQFSKKHPPNVKRRGAGLQKTPFGFNITWNEPLGASYFFFLTYS